MTNQRGPLPDSGRSCSRGRGQCIRGMGGKNASNISGRLDSDFGRGWIPRNFGVRTCWPAPPLSIVGPCSTARDFIGVNGGAGNNTRSGRLSWADIRRYSQWNDFQNSVFDDSSSWQSDKSHHTVHIDARDGGWGGRGRGRLLDAASGRRVGSSHCKVNSGSWVGRGRGRILYTYNSSNRLEFRHGQIGDRGTPSVTHCDGGSDQNSNTCVTTNSVHCLLSPEKRVSSASCQTQQQQEQQQQKQKKKKKKWHQRKQQQKNNGKDDRADDGTVSSTVGADSVCSHIQKIALTELQESDLKTKSNVEKYQKDFLVTSSVLRDGVSPATQGVSHTTACVQKQVEQEKNSKLENHEAASEEQQLASTVKVTDAVSADAQKATKPNNCSTKQQSDKKTYKPQKYCAGRDCDCRKPLVALSTAADRGTVGIQNSSMCTYGVNEQQSGQQINSKPENNYPSRGRGAARLVAAASTA